MASDFHLNALEKYFLLSCIILLQKCISHIKSVISIHKNPDPDPGSIMEIFLIISRFFFVLRVKDFVCSFVNVNEIIFLTFDP